MRAGSGAYMASVLTIVPARGGSKRLQRKNILPIDGQPLFARTAASCDGRVVVATDDDMIASMARARGFEVYHRPPVSGSQTIPEMAQQVARGLNWPGDVLVVQPTVQPIRWYEISAMITMGQDENIPLVAAVRFDHNHWYAIRMEQLDYELGVYFWPSGQIGVRPVSPFLFGDAGHYTDIDTPLDYYSASLQRRHILFDAPQVETWVGSGHRRRAGTLADSLQHHHIYFPEDPPVPVDLVVRDRGNSKIEDITKYGSLRVLTLEDHGPGAAIADLAIDPFTDPEYAVLRPEFLGLPPFEVMSSIDRIMIMFGGTDARKLGLWSKRATSGRGFVFDAETDVGGVAEMMLESDLLITGAGQTVQEAAHVGIPTIVIAATMREAAHPHLGSQHGNLYLGSFAEVNLHDLSRAITAAEDPRLREEMSQKGQAIVDGKGLQRMVHAIEGLLI